MTDEIQRYGDYCVAQVYVQLVHKKIRENNCSEQEACDEIGIAYYTYRFAEIVVESYSASHPSSQPSPSQPPHQKKEKLMNTEMTRTEGVVRWTQLRQARGRV